MNPLAHGKDVLEATLLCHFAPYHMKHKERRASDRSRTQDEGKKTMLWTIFVILLVLWLLGMVSSYTLGGYIHILLVIAVVVLIIRLIQGRSAL